ncbi:MAG: ImmA/IrrE family metallo-endopeptidase [Parcubacteria group bacterium]|nr:ImmA/IrrE family metallo-endopeptidase [Parcubacteria group bacterium]
MNKVDICKKAEELAKKYNPEGLSPFPFEKIIKDKKDLLIFESEKLEERISGAIVIKDSIFYIFVNKNKVKTRQYFTMAHELGHYFLHKEIIRKEKAIIDEENSLDGNTMLYRLDDYERSRIETEANNFAASLIMPKELVIEAWKEIKNVTRCAEIFSVSASAMAIRLERLSLI